MYNSYAQYMCIICSPLLLQHHCNPHKTNDQKISYVQNLCHKTCISIVSQKPAMHSKLSLSSAASVPLPSQQCSKLTVQAIDWLFTIVRIVRIVSYSTLPLLQVLYCCHTILAESLQIQRWLHLHLTSDIIPNNLFATNLLSMVWT